MTAEELRDRIPISQLSFSASRSSGPGGQNVNKVSSKVEVRFCITGSALLSDQEKEKLLGKLAKRINTAGEIIVVSQSERTQLMNRKKAEERLFKLLAAALTDKPSRKATRPSSASKAKRMNEKRLHSNIKKLRKKSDLSESGPV